MEYEQITHQWQQDINHKLSEIISLLKASKQANTTKQYWDSIKMTKDDVTCPPMTINPVSSQPQNTKERIEVTRFLSEGMSDCGNWYRFHISKSPNYGFPNIKEDKYASIKKAIEEVLNPSEFPTEEVKRLTEQYKNMTDHLRKCKYTEDDIKIAFQAAREVHPPYPLNEKIYIGDTLPSNLSMKLMYKNFQDFLTSNPFFPNK